MNKTEIFSTLIWYKVFLVENQPFSQMYSHTFDRIMELTEKYSQYFSTETKVELELHFKEIWLQMSFDMDSSTKNWLEATFLTQVEENLQNLGYEEEGFINMIVDIFNQVFDEN